MATLLPLLVACMMAGDTPDPVERVADYIEPRAADTVDVPFVARLLVDATVDATEAGCEDVPDPLLLACIARYESGFKVTADNGTCKGLLQVHRCHRKSMKKMGMDYDSEADRLQYGCWLYSWHGLEPWTTRKLATRDYKEATKDE